ncbi:Probable disease resistance protein At5g66900 [Linum perenne]
MMVTEEKNLGFPLVEARSSSSRSSRSRAPFLEIAMAASFVGGAALGALLGELLRAVVKVQRKTLMFKHILESLQSTLDAIIPIVEEIQDLDKVLDRDKREVGKLLEEIKRGKKLVLECSKIRWYACWKRPRHAEKLLGLDKSLKIFCQIVGQLQQSRDTKETLLEVKDVYQDVKRLILNGKTGTIVSVAALNGFHVPEPPTNAVGLEFPLKELKMEVFKDETPLVVVSAPPGCGKTTLAKLFCNDMEVQDIFKGNIFFITVSKKPTTEGIVRKLFQHNGYKVPDLRSEEDAVFHLEQFLKNIRPDPILFVLDDVWPESVSLVENFQFQIPSYKILVTSRSVFPQYGSMYKLTPLNYNDSRTLFCNWAFFPGQAWDIPSELVNQMVKGCKGFPLSLKIVGRSLCGEPVEIWKKREMEISKVGSIFEYSDLLYCLQRSLDALDSNPTVKECFKDLASFPEDHLIPATALIDMWAEMYKLDDTGLQAISNLHELCTRNLADIVVTRADANSYSQQFVTQHDLLRELAIHQTNLGTFEQRERLILEVTGNDVPDWWMEQKQLRIDSRLMSIATDERFSRTWCNIQAPKLEVLVLNCHTKSYTLPEFITGLDKLKTLIIMNHGILPAEVPNFQLLGRLSNLRKIRLERISVPLSGFTSVQFRKLEKITLVLCHIGQAFSPSSTIVVSEALPKLIEINIDYCKDLVEFPSGIGQLTELKRLRITNCHNLATLPREIGKLVNLEDLRLSSCIELAELPDTIGNLQNLSILDISECVDIRRLPQQIRELQNLRKLKMMGCSTGFELPESIFSLEHLEEVECDEETEGVWEPFACVLGNLKIKAACHL